ncbi:MAG: hypothetical protein HYX69_17850 [Planctomycetia bacterium]|nr:hypothetical protein [Planctomycetia bacterium]
MADSSPPADLLDRTGDADISDLSRAAQDIAGYAAKLIDWAHGLPDPMSPEHSPSDPAFLIEVLCQSYAGQKDTPDAVREFAEAMPANIKSMMGLSAASYHALAWRVAERILHEIGEAVGSTSLVGFNPAIGKTHVRLPPYGRVSNWKELVQMRLRKLDRFDGQQFIALIAREGQIAEGIRSRRTEPDANRGGGQHSRTPAENPTRHEFMSLAARFRRADSPLLLRDTCIEAARAFKRAVDSGRLRIDADLPWPAETMNTADAEGQWARTWALIVSAVAESPDAPLNPHALRWQNEGAIGATDPDEWRRRSEQYAAVCDWLAGQARQSAGATAPDVTVQGATVQGANDRPGTSGEAKNATKAKWLAEAMILVREHPDWPDAEIARRVGKHKSRLSRSREYQTAAAFARGNKTDLPRGHVTVSADSGSRDVDAVAPPDAGDDQSDRGHPIPGSKYVREYCAECGEPMKVTPDKVGTAPVCQDCQT